MSNPIFWKKQKDISCMLSIKFSLLKHETGMSGSTYGMTLSSAFLSLYSAWNENNNDNKTVFGSKKKANQWLPYTEWLWSKERQIISNVMYLVEDW